MVGVEIIRAKQIVANGMKVDQELQGSKVGERLLHKAFVYAQAKDIDFSGRSSKLMEAGDLLLFYRSEDRHSIEVLGVVQEAVRLVDRDGIFNLVKRRTVYSLWEIDQWVKKYPDGVFVICFDVIRYFEKPVGLDFLRSIGLAHPQSIAHIADDGKYRAIMEAGR